MIKFYRKLISGNNDTSSRRFIAVWTLPYYWAAIVVGITVGAMKADFRFFLAALIASAIPILLAFFALTWEHVKGILNTQAFKKKSSGYFDNDNEIIDP